MRALSVVNCQSIAELSSLQICSHKATE